MSSKDVNFKIKVGVDGQGKVSVLKSDVEDLGKAFSLAQSGADGFLSVVDDSHDVFLHNNIFLGLVSRKVVTHFGGNW